LAILLLDELGKINLSDPVTDYIPWLSFRYKNTDYDMSKLTIANLLYHTSGLINHSHIKLILMSGSGNMIEKNVRAISGAELDFEPSSKCDTVRPIIISSPI
jgi:putative ATP-binding cassette transporter